MDQTVLFSEKQRFRQAWLWILLSGVTAFSIFGMVRQLYLGQPFGQKPLPDSGLIFSVLFLLLLNYLFFSFRLETYIRTDGIYVRFFPFHIKFRQYTWDQLAQVYVRQYQPISEYGGWGLRGIGRNRALNVSGNKGIQLETLKGAKLLIGTNKPEEVSELLKRLGYWRQNH
ncbi:MAG TPA: hypothetical protein VL092_13595 [Chitinophagaceae bacterium]|nr:hypothetical protein [Chitinophagaceae bacterium]